MATINGTTAKDRLIGTALRDLIFGFEENDSLIGNEGDDALDGGLGIDVMTGGLGNDSYIVDNLRDVTIEGLGQGIDTVFSSVNHTLRANIEWLVLTGTALIGKGNAMDNRITGNAGNNALDGGLGADTLIGGQGNDSYVVDNARDVVIEALDQGYDTVRASMNHTLRANVERLILTGSAIVGKGNTLNNRIDGNAANNTLNGGAGADVLVGRLGNDFYEVDNAGDVVAESLGQGVDIVRASVNHTLRANVENLILSGTALTGTGNALDNRITGSVLGNTLDGGAGNDRLAGGQGDDTYVLDSEGDVVTELAGQGIDTLRISFPAEYHLGANIENLVLLAGANEGYGNALDNRMIGNALDNTFDGGAGNDTLIGGQGDDYFIVDSENDVVTEVAGEGYDTVQSSVNYTLGDHIEGLGLVGTALNGTGNGLDNEIEGNANRNELRGGAGNDTFYGIAGGDTLIGGTGNDTYTVTSGDMLIELEGEGTDNVISNVDHVLATHIENLTLSGAALSGIGNALDNTITGNALANTLDGGVGADTLAGGRGNDTYQVDNIGDVVTELVGEGTDTVNSTVSYSLATAGGAGVENLTLSDAAISGTGNDLDNEISGNALANTLSGGGGNDILQGTAGAADTLIGGTGDDTYYASNIADVVTELAGEGTDLVFSFVNFSLAIPGAAHVENLTLIGAGTIGTGNALDNIIIGTGELGNTLSGGDGNDTLIGGLGDDMLTGGDGNDTLEGIDGSNTLNGGAGDDTYILSSFTDVITENADEGTDTVRSAITHILGAQLENRVLIGTAGTGTGNGLANTITGNDSNNTLDGSLGADTMIGGLGNDTYVVESIGDVVIELASQGLTDTVKSSINYTLGANIERLELTGAALNGTGNNIANTIIGNDLDNVIDGGQFGDIMNGGKGDDTYVVDAFNDSISELVDEGIDTVRTSSNGFILGANIENLVLTGSASQGTGNALDNILTGNALVNALRGGGGNDLLDGGTGADNLAGQIGDDTYIVDNSADQVIELAGQGTDTVRSSVDLDFTSDALFGYELENLILTGAAVNGTGNELDNAITGNGLVNALKGELGNDVLAGGGGADALEGGGGVDTFVLNLGTGTDAIKDFGLDNGNIIEQFRVSKAEFGLAPGFVMSADNLVLTNGTSDATLEDTPQFIYDQWNFILYFDGDGSKTDINPIAIAELPSGNNATLVLANFDFIA